MTRAFARTALAGAAAGALLSIGVAMPAAAETDTVRMAQQFGMLYVPQHVVIDQKLVEKHAKALGLPEPKVELFKISGGANINKALLADTIDFGAHGIGPALKLWGKSEGAFKAAVSMTEMPLKLITNDPNIKSLDDYVGLEDHKIATPAAQVSIQAVTLQIATQDKWGDPKKLDNLVVSMKHPTALAALMSGGQSVKSHFATLPYSWQELNQGEGKLHTVLSSYDIMGGPHTTVVLSASQKFKDDNPKIFQAVVNAHIEAYEWINANKTAAAELFIRFTDSKLEPAAVKAMIEDSNEIFYSEVPKHTMKYAKFLHEIGDIPEAKSWKDYFFDNNHKFSGS